MKKTADLDSVDVLDESIINLCIHLHLPGHRAQRKTADSVSASESVATLIFVLICVTSLGEHLLFW